MLAKAPLFGAIVYYHFSKASFISVSCHLLLEVIWSFVEKLSAATPFQSVRPAIRTPFSGKAMHRPQDGWWLEGLNAKSLAAVRIILVPCARTLTWTDSKH